MMNDTSTDSARDADHHRAAKVQWRNQQHGQRGDDHFVREPSVSVWMAP